MDKKYHSIFISDIHLGTKDSKAIELIDFLKNKYTTDPTTSLY